LDLGVGLRNTDRKRYKTRSRIISTFTIEDEGGQHRIFDDRAYLIYVELACRIFSISVVLRMVMIKEKQILLETPHIWIIFHQLIVNQIRIESLPKS
jgi:hypothetical protein